MYRPATSHTVTWPCGIADSRLNGAAIESTGSAASGVPATAAALTAWPWTRLMKSSAAVYS